MKSLKNNPIVFVIFFLLFILIIGIVGSDFIAYQSIMEGDYKTPWYNPSWLSQPYTNLRLSQYKSTYSVTTNDAGNQMWIVKETKVGDKKFWTVDYRYDLLGNVPLDPR